MSVVYGCVLSLNWLKLAVLTMTYFSQLNNNTQPYTTDIYHKFIIRLLHELNQSLIQIYFILQHMSNLQIELVQNTPDDGPMRSETCRANILDE